MFAMVDHGAPLNHAARMPFTKETAAHCGQRGGLAVSPVRLEKLKALHARMRGVRRNEDASVVMAVVRSAIAEGASARGIAREAGVNARTMGRWLKGQHYPSPAPRKRLEGILERFRGMREAGEQSAPTAGG